MRDIETKTRRRTKRKLMHRAAQLRKMADELDAVAAELDPRGPDHPTTPGDTPREHAVEADGELAI